MQGRNIFSQRSVSVPTYFLALSFFVFSVVANADQPLELPKTVSDLRKNTDNSSTAPSQLNDPAFKASLKAEILDELRGDYKSTRQPKKAKLNFLELAGYFRTRADALSRCDLGTFVPSLNFGTSQCAPPISYFGNAPNDNTLGTGSWLLSADARLRVDPTFNVSEDVRIRGRFDFLDNIVLGSTPAYMTGIAGQANPAAPIAVLSPWQNSPLQGVNSQFGPLAVKRLWGEVAFPYGEFRFGRMPYSWGLGILYSGGDDITQDFGTNVDGFFFTTRIWGHELTPGFTMSYAGPTGRGGGLGVGGDNQQRWLAAEGGSRYDLDPTDNVYNLHISFARKDSANDIQALLDDNRLVWNYGALGIYRFQIVDSAYTTLSDASLQTLRTTQVSRNAHLGIISLWSKIMVGHLQIEAEAVGNFGQIGNGIGLWDVPTKTDPIWIYSGGIALESRYGFMQDRLQIGLDAGWASGDDAPGFGTRPGIVKNPQGGSADGAQFAGGDNTITNFSFDRDYRVDLMLFREVLGTVSDALYVKPHVAWYFTENLGLRGDVVGSMSNFTASTPNGGSQFLGLELDASLFFKTNDGFMFNLQYGYLFPFAGLNHNRPRIDALAGDSAAEIYQNFGEAKSGSAIRFIAGIAF